MCGWLMALSLGGAFGGFSFEKLKNEEQDCHSEPRSSRYIQE